ncbi:sensor histidine kinase [Granulosicoccus antarcticus]|uniref:histidine kinase n=1 Tax=Granulosicoccus antarcticus IMCC3135 TaxID=1192854 RepID=A0A2Z2NVX0_9GAMM|nr:HAMP domain-containing sensor histidine kinase [Granulosicoccus antarcticus]ASJ75383.1 Phytochrome-like protein cph1 [Granulosicoccus antarcticus IMCC3135]
MGFSNILKPRGVQWFIVPLIIVLLISVQFWVGARVQARTLDLRHSLNTTYGVALELTQVLGYGGLIHHFKNFLLRPDEIQYLEAGKEAARTADELVWELEQSASSLGFETTLSNTRSIIDGYSERLQRIPGLVDSGMSAHQLDRALRLDDRFAIQEISSLLDQLSVSVNFQVENIETQGRILNLVSLAGTIALSLLILTLFIQRRHRNEHMISIDALNEQLAASNSRLTEANTSLKQFAGIVSHDLKGPLRHISLFNNQILEDIDNGEMVRNHVCMSQASVLRITELISSLLDFTKTGFKQPELILIDIKPLIMDVVSEFQIPIDETHARVTVQAEGKILADALLIRRVLHNLMDNSLKYMKTGLPPDVNIVAKYLDDLEGGAMQIVISDNGIGIPCEHAQRVFEPLQRLHSGQAEYSGTGIGLSLARTVVNAHGGQIKVDDDYRGGTRICITLPCQANLKKLDARI